MNKLVKSSAIAFGALFLFTFTGCESIMPDKLIWKNEDADQTKAKREEDKQKEEITPDGLKTGMSTPISPEEAKKTALSRPQVVNTEEPGKTRAKKKYFDVVEEPSDVTLAPVIDKSATPIRVTTYDNNSVQKDYRMRFGVVWERVIESILELPMNTIDRSSGIIVTDWIVDQGKSNILGMFGGGKALVRYKYTVRIMDRGAMTSIKVVPFAQSVKDRRWSPAKPSLKVTQMMFRRIERELAVPLPTPR